MPRRVLWSLVAVLFACVPAWADDEVFLRGGAKPYKNYIKNESARGIDITGKKEMIAAEDIVDILYNVTPGAVMISTYRPAFNKERAYFDPSLRKDPKEKTTLAEIIKAYSEAYPQVKEKNAQRHLEYKIAFLSIIQAQEDGVDPEPAVQRLVNFKVKHPDSWQIAPALRMLGSAQIAQKKFKEAEETYMELAAANIAADAKLEGELLAAQVGVRAGKVKESLKKLDDILVKLPKDSKFFAKARIAKAESLAAAKSTAEAVTLLRQIIKESADKNVKASAYNALGEAYFQAAAYKEARWEFLWVDVVYNQDKNEHARALYYLSQVFEKLGDTEKAKEFRETLIADRQFAGSEWQRLAVQAAKTP